MADDDDNLNDFTLAPHSNEDADTQLDAKALKLVEDYVASLNRSKNENDIRGEIRTNIVKLGIHSLAFQHELTAQKMMDAQDRREYMAGRKRMGRVLADKQATLFPEELERIRKRKDKAKEKATKAAAAAAEAKAKSIEAGDDNPRSKPKASSAIPPKKPGRKPKVVAGSAADRATETSERNARLADAQAASPGATGTLSAAEANAAAEQELGGKILDAAGKPLSQSAIAQQKLEEAKLA